MKRSKFYLKIKMSYKKFFCKYFKDWCLQKIVVWMIKRFFLFIKIYWPFKDKKKKQSLGRHIRFGTENLSTRLKIEKRSSVEFQKVRGGRFSCAQARPKQSLGIVPRCLKTHCILWDQRHYLFRIEEEYARRRGEKEIKKKLINK